MANLQHLRLQAIKTLPNEPVSWQNVINNKRLKAYRVEQYNQGFDNETDIRSSGGVDHIDRRRRTGRNNRARVHQFATERESRSVQLHPASRGHETFPQRPEDGSEILQGSTSGTGNPPIQQPLEREVLAALQGMGPDGSPNLFKLIEERGPVRFPLLPGGRERGRNHHHNRGRELRFRADAAHNPETVRPRL